MHTQHLALITGGSRGIGAATVKRLSAEGYAVAAVCRKQIEQAEDICAAQRRYGYSAYAFQADISNETAVKTLTTQVEAQFGRLPDILINNAGIAKSGVLADMQTTDFDEIFAVNMRGPFLLCRALYDDMVRCRYGRIVNISSMWGISGASCEVLYSASKAALIGFTKALALELAPSGITVNAVAPGVIQTDMLSCYDADILRVLAEETPVGRLGTPEDIAAVTAFLVSEEASFVTGQVLGANGGFIT